MLDVPEITFTALDGEYRLEPPTPRIAFRVSRKVGGLGTALARCQAGDLDVYAAVLRVACPDAPQGEREIEAFVFENLASLALPLARYVWSLQNGGRMPPGMGRAADAESSGDGDSPPPRPSPIEGEGEEMPGNGPAAAGKGGA